MDKLDLGNRMALLEERLWGLSESGNPPEEIVRGWMTPQQVTPTPHNELATLEKVYNELKMKKAQVDAEYERAVAAHREQVKQLNLFLGPQPSKKVAELKLGGLEVLRIESDVPPDVAASLVFR
ncbi:hypothetical protein GNI_106530 [Gregarina niphandrodes]|uniref:Uncharacterized protein n=1 Tax=Gregarina niphandrodes TaxID=110365 RepID=A0A023B454_GRENI|nr:hypothetical protein GNI_106530 [Gregarina niphandrodes]EZG55993.1 hypothetical protein GNI_106530 [Gregarina niphandrodes]|eukprot:XP_011131381.1 hypothetical protein GNI_106530 [Gregarina niphandrodes]